MSKRDNLSEGGPAQQGGAASFDKPVDEDSRKQDKPIPHKREDARERLAYILVGAFLVLIVFYAACALFTGDSFDRVDAFMRVVFSGMLGLVGSVVGFYFGSQR